MAPPGRPIQRGSEEGRGCWLGLSRPPVPPASPASRRWPRLAQLALPPGFPFPVLLRPFFPPPPPLISCKRPAETFFGHQRDEQLAQQRRPPRGEGHPSSLGRLLSPGPAPRVPIPSKTDPDSLGPSSQRSLQQQPQSQVSPARTPQARVRPCPLPLDGGITSQVARPPPFAPSPCPDPVCGDSSAAPEPVSLAAGGCEPPASRSLLCCPHDGGGARAHSEAHCNDPHSHRTGTRSPSVE